MRAPAAGPPTPSQLSFFCTHSSTCWQALIQRTVRSAFGHATVLTIAHRLSSVLDADKIMVLEAGRLVEFGSPQELMAKSGGAFRQLVVSGASS